MQTSGEYANKAYAQGSEYGQKAYRPMGEKQACRLGSEHTHTCVKPTPLPRCVHRLKCRPMTCESKAPQPA